VVKFGRRPLSSGKENAKMLALSQGEFFKLAAGIDILMIVEGHLGLD
jgi:hypothetical protein